MNTNRKTAIVVGVLFLTATAAFMLFDSGLIESILDDPDYPITVSENKSQVLTGMIVFIPGALIEVILPIWFFVKGFNPSAIDTGSA
jgi:hypothetical protein